MYLTFREACFARGLLGGDVQWSYLFDETIVWAISRQLRNLFVTVLMHCEIGDAAALFEKYWRYMTDDIVCMIRNALGKQSYAVPDVLLRSRLLKDLGVLFSENGGSITAYNLPPSVSASGSLVTNRLLFEETC